MRYFVGSMYGFGLILFSVITLADTADNPQLNSKAIDHSRLFFNAAQRQASVISAKAIPPDKHINSIKPIPANQSKEVTRHTSVVRYNGVIQSERGIQLLFNGMPWRVGQFDIASARLQLATQQVEIKTTHGAKFHLLPGESVELKP